jgi:hypothetical protein
MRGATVSNRRISFFETHIHLKVLTLPLVILFQSTQSLNEKKEEKREREKEQRTHEGLR